MSAANFRRSCSVTAVNLSPKPRPGTTCLTTASARICPSPTRKSTLVGEPIVRGGVVSRNSPPRLTSHTHETSSRPLHCQQTQTSCVIAIRELSLRKGVAVFLLLFLWSRGLLLAGPGQQESNKGSADFLRFLRKLHEWNERLPNTLRQASSGGLHARIFLNTAIVDPFKGPPALDPAFELSNFIHRQTQRGWPSRIRWNSIIKSRSLPSAIKSIGFRLCRAGNGAFSHSQTQMGTSALRPDAAAHPRR